MSIPFRAAVIPARDRVGMLADCVESLSGQLNALIIIDNASEPAITKTMLPDIGHGEIFIHRVDDTPPNISRLWNHGIDAVNTLAQIHGADEWDIAILNSDTIIPPHWMNTLSDAMRDTTAVCAYPDQFGGTRQMLHTKAEPINLYYRITGYAYMLKGEASLRIDETMEWWMSDDDIDWTAREAGGSLLVPGIPVIHKSPGESTNANLGLSEQAGRDKETFRKKWGGRTPW